MAEVALITAYNAQGELLLGKRLDSGKWTLPGGHLEEGEDSLEGARRELLEETSLEAETLSPITTYILKDGTVLHCFSAYVTGEPHGANDPDHEVEDWKFIDVSEGIPSAIASKLQGPKDADENLLLRIFNLEEKDDLQKHEGADEISRLLQHPNPHERAMALLLHGVEPKHLDIAAQDEDPMVHLRALGHPSFDASALMGSGKTAQQLSFLALPKGPRAEHLVTLYSSSFESPDKERLHSAIAGHRELGQDLARALYRDPRVSFQVRLALMQHPNVPQDVLEDAVRTAQLAPGDWSELAKAALMHPKSMPAMAEDVVRKGLASNESHHRALADFVLRNRWVAPSLIDEVLMLSRIRGELHPLAQAALQNPAATPAQSHSYIASLLQPPEPPAAVQKSEPNLGVSGDPEVIEAMLGFKAHLTEAFRAAAFLAGGGALPLERIRRALWTHEGDLEAAALASYGYEVNDANRAALRAVLSLETVQKAEPLVATAKDVVASTPSGQDVAQEVTRAYRDQFVFPVKLGSGAKHSDGTLLARDVETGTTWLLKPGSGGQSSAAGADQDSASQSAREAAWYHLSRDYGLNLWFPRAELLLIDGRQYAAMQLLPWNYKTLDKRKVTDPAIGRRVFQPLLSQGNLHRLACLYFIAGEPDGHANNVMVDDQDHVRLIDHGSSFAGTEFDPAHDQNSFVPAFMRAWSPDAFNHLPADEKLKALPRVAPAVAADLRSWVDALSGERLAETLHRYGIDPAPSIARLEKLKEAVSREPADLAINRLWTTV